MTKPTKISKTYFFISTLPIYGNSKNSKKAAVKHGMVLLKLLFGKFCGMEDVGVFDIYSWKVLINSLGMGTISLSFH